MSCLDTSSRPTLSFEIATEISSFAGSFDEDDADEGAFTTRSGGCRASPALDRGWNASPDRIAFAYSFASKFGEAKTAYGVSVIRL